MNEQPKHRKINHQSTTQLKARLRELAQHGGLQSKHADNIRDELQAYGRYLEPELRYNGGL